MIETNVRQRGTIGGTDEQIRKRVDALKEYMASQANTMPPIYNAVGDEECKYAPSEV